MTENEAETQENEENTNSRTKLGANGLDKLKRRIIRSVARLVHKEKKTNQEVWQALKKETGTDCQVLWSRMRALTLKKLQRSLIAGDKISCLPVVARMNVTDWTLFDLVLVHEDIDVIGRNDPSIQKEPRALVELFNIVQRFGIEGCPKDQLLDAWTAAVKHYNISDGRICSPMLAQKRWYQMKEFTRHQFYNFWQSYRGNPRLLVKAQTYMPSPLQKAIASRYPNVITKPFKTWEELVEVEEIVLPEQFENNKNRNLPKPLSENDPDLVIVEREVEIIDLASDDDTLDKNNEKPEDNTFTGEDDNAINEEENDINQHLLTETDEVSQNDNENFEVSIKNEPLDIEETVIGHSFTERYNESVRMILQEDEQLEEIENAERENVCEESNIIECMKEKENNDCVENTLNVTENITYSTVPENLIKDIDLRKSSDVEIIDDRDIDVTQTSEKSQELANAGGTGYERALPLITSVFGNVDIDKSNLRNLDTNSLQSPITSCEVQNLDDEDDVGDIIKVDDYIKESQNLNQQSELEYTIKKASPVDEVLLSDKKTQEVLDSSIPTGNITKRIEDTFEDVTLIDDGIEFVDEGIVEEDSDEPRKKSAAEIDIAPEDFTREETPSFDLKLLMHPVVFTKKIDYMDCLKDKLFTTVAVGSILDEIILQSKPKSKKSVNINIETSDLLPEQKKVEQTDTNKPSDENIDNADIFQTNYNSTDENKDFEIISEKSRVKKTSSLLRKPIHRQYHPIQLCKNPDFNTRLKRLNMGFFSITRNIRLLKFCKPLTIDVHKAFESKLINGTLYLKGEETYKQTLDIYKEKVITHTASIAPSAVPIQSLVNSTETDADEIISEVKVASYPIKGNIKEYTEVPIVYKNTETGENLLNRQSVSNFCEVNISVRDDVPKVKCLGDPVEIIAKETDDIPKTYNCVPETTGKPNSSCENSIEICHDLINPKNDLNYKNKQKLDKLMSKSSKAVLDLHNCNKAISEMSRIKMSKKYRKVPTKRKESQVIWDAKVKTAPKCKIDDFLITPDTLMKMLQVLRFVKENNDPPEQIQVQKKKKSKKLGRKPKIQKPVVATNESNTESEIDTATKSIEMRKCDRLHNEDDEDCLCTSCVAKCECPACIPKSITHGNPKRKRSRTSKQDKIVSKRNSKSLKQFYPDLLISSNEKKLKTKIIPKKTIKKVIELTPKINHIATNSDEIESFSQKPVAHIRIMPKNMNSSPYTHSSSQTQENEMKVTAGHIVIDGTQPIKSTSSVNRANNNPIYLGKNKILMTTTQFPEYLEGVTDQVALPSPYKNLLHPNLQLPKGVNLQVSPNGELTLAINPKAKLTTEQRRMMPFFLETIQKVMCPSLLNLNNQSTKKLSTQNISSEIIISDDEESQSKGSVSNNNIDLNESNNITSHVEGALVESPNNSETPNDNSGLDSINNISTQVDTIPVNITSNNNEVLLQDASHAKQTMREDANQIDATTSVNEYEMLTPKPIVDKDKLMNNDISVQDNRDQLEGGMKDDGRTNRKSLLSDLMQMSGISIEDVLPTTVIDTAPPNMKPVAADDVFAGNAMEASILAAGLVQATHEALLVSNADPSASADENSVPTAPEGIVAVNVGSTEGIVAANVGSTEGIAADVIQAISHSDFASNVVLSTPEYVAAGNITNDTPGMSEQNLTKVLNDTRVVRYETVTSQSISVNTRNKSNPKMYELNIVSSYAKLKYVLDNKGEFFKLDLDTGILTRINVAIKKKKTTRNIKQTFEQIDLTEEPDSEDVVSEEIQDTKGITESALRVRNNLFPSDINRRQNDAVLLLEPRLQPQLQPRLQHMLRPEAAKQLGIGTHETPTLRQIRMPKPVRPVRIYKAFPSILRKPNAPKLLNYSLLRNTSKKSNIEVTLKKKKNYRAIVPIATNSNSPEDRERMLEEFLNESESGDSQDSEADKSSNISNESEDESDDEPLAKKAKRIHGIEEKNVDVGDLNPAEKATKSKATEMPIEDNVGIRMETKTAPVPLASEIVGVIDPAMYLSNVPSPSGTLQAEYLDSSDSEEGDCILGV